MRRHQSLNYPNAASGVRRLQQGLKRAGTLQAPPVRGGSQVGTPYSGAQSPSPTNADEEYDNDYADNYFDNGEAEDNDDLGGGGGGDEGGGMFSREIQPGEPD